MRRLVVLTACTLTLLSLACPPARCGDKKTEKFEPIVVNGLLVPTDLPDRMTGGPSKLHRFDLKKDKVYMILVTSDNYQSHVRIEDPDGQTLASQQGHPATRVRFAPTKDGNFQIAVATFPGAQGAFKLTLREMSPEDEPFRVTKVHEFENKNELVVESVLAREDPVDPARNQVMKLYSFKLSAKQRYTITMHSKQFDSYLRLLDSRFNPLAQDDDGDGFPNARIVYQVPADGTYHIVATTFNGQVGAFTIRVRKQ